MRWVSTRQSRFPSPTLPAAGRLFDLHGQGLRIEAELDPYAAVPRRRPGLLPCVGMTAAELAARLEQVERLLGESSAVLDTVLVSSPAGIAIWDRDLRYVRVNETYAAMN